MSETPDILKAGWDAALNGAPADQVLPALAAIGEGDPRFPEAQHLRGYLALRWGDAARALPLLTDAIRRGHGRRAAWLRLAAAASRLGWPDESVAMVQDLLRRLAPGDLDPFVVDLVRATDFANKELSAAKDATFERLLLTILPDLLAREAMDAAMLLEGAIYEFYVKPTETDAHFQHCMSRLEPLFTAAGRAWRERLPALPRPPMRRPYRIGFFIHSASMLAHIEVLLNTLKGYRRLADQPFEPIVYCFSGKDPRLEAALTELSVPIVMLKERFPEAANSSWRRLLRLRESVAEDGVHEVIWVSLVTILPLAFGLRIAPVQTWWAMKYRNFSQPDIDGYVTGSALTRYSTFAGRRWRMGRLGVDDWYDPALEGEAAAIRARFAGKTILMTLGRTEKMRDADYLSAVVTLLKRHPEAVFLWAGREEDPIVVKAFAKGGVLAQTHFIGWVNTRLYAQVADIFLDTFPFPCGFTLFQAMAAAKPVVVFDASEAAQAGLMSFIKPLLDGDEGTAEERQELRSLVGDPDAPMIAIARSSDDYVRCADRLITDHAARAAAGGASKRFMDRYFSSSTSMGASFTSHFVELVDEAAARAS